MARRHINLYMTDFVVRGIGLLVNDEYHVTADIRPTVGDPEELTVCVSRSTRSNCPQDKNPLEQSLEDSEHLVLEEIRPVVELEDIVPHGISHVTLRHPKFKNLPMWMDS